MRRRLRRITPAAAAGSAATKLTIRALRLHRSCAGFQRWCDGCHRQPALGRSHSPKCTQPVHAAWCSRPFRSATHGARLPKKPAKHEFPASLRLRPLAAAPWVASTCGLLRETPACLCLPVLACLLIGTKLWNVYMTRGQRRRLRVTGQQAGKNHWALIYRKQGNVHSPGTIRAWVKQAASASHLVRRCGSMQRRQCVACITGPPWGGGAAQRSHCRSGKVGGWVSRQACASGSLAGSGTGACARRLLHPHF